MSTKPMGRNKGLIVSLIAAAAFAIGYGLGGPGLIAADDHAGHDHGKTEHSAHWQAVDKMHLYLCAFHIGKEQPSFQVEAHHFCSPAGNDMHQCVIYDSKGPNAKLIGIEYLITDKTYQGLPTEEKKYWHPHAYEIVSGQLIAPDLPKQGDDLFKGLITTWGKTWHTWRDPAQPMPYGEPMLMWSANGDGQITEKNIETRDAQFGIKTNDIRERRKAYGYDVPNIPPPKNINENGRRWTPSGADEPRRLTDSGGGD